MPDYSDYADKINTGRGKVADRLGRPHSVYRPTANGSGDFIQDPHRFRQNVPIFYKMASQNILAGLEVDRKLNTQWYEVLMDPTDFKVGDVAVVTDSVYGAGKTSVSWAAPDQFQGYCLVSIAPVKPTLAAGCNTTAQFYREATALTADGRFARTLDEAAPVRFVNGTWILGTVGQTADKIPCGIMPFTRIGGDRNFADVQGMSRKTWWSLYVPPLKGYRFAEGDRVKLANGALYVVYLAHHSDFGTVGNWLILEREEAQV